MSESIELIIREAVPDDAAALLAFMDETARQTDFLFLETEERDISVEEEQEHLAELFDSASNCLFVALDGGRMIGAASVHSSDEQKIHHIGDVGIVVHEEFWGMGLGTVLMEEIIAWSEETGILKRLQLQVQERNTRARNLYEKVGFRLEGVMERGVFIDGEYLPVCLMSRLIGNI
ncbi:GNAT family N-acetyltransferase [Atopococcus tabaci]|uniref:GNAT family N-acetyltransferase n=1 Tax=Atopococcus tabaci TaxID=269774 RepID=UPI0004229070|nr:GNAT family protein [Atopococcus tabaci]